MTPRTVGWDAREQQLLDAIAQFEAAGDEDLQLSNEHLGEATGLDRMTVQRGLLALHEAGYITGIDAAAEEECYLICIRLLERGYRATSLWPSDDATSDLLSIIEQQAEATDDPEEKSRLQKLLAGAQGVGTATMQQMLTAWLRHVAGV